MCAKALSNFFHQSSKWTKLVFNVSDIYILFDGLTYNTCGHFASCVVLYAKPSNKRFIIPLQKGVILIHFYLVRVFLKKCIICPSGR